MVFDYGVNIALVGKDQASREAIVDLIVYQFFNGKNFTELGDRTVSGWIENRVGKEEFSTIAGLTTSKECQFIMIRVLKEKISGLSEDDAAKIVNTVIDKINEQ